jgi:ClpP class serine protease
MPSGSVGSIGVFAAHEDLSAALEKEGIKMTLISAGKYKVAGNPFEKLSDEERAEVQARVNDAYGQFVKDVARGRETTPAAVRSGYGEGRMLEAKAAKAAGMIDRIATMDETLARLTARPVRVSAGGMRGEETAPAMVAVVDSAEPVVAPVPLPEDTLARRMRIM